jgi:hypothetical protein
MKRQDAVGWTDLRPARQAVNRESAKLSFFSDRPFHGGIILFFGCGCGQQCNRVGCRIRGGCILPGANRDARAKEIDNLLSLSEQHRELWRAVPQRKDLSRIFRPDADVLPTPATVEETEFLNLVIVHFQTGWRIAKNGGLTTLKELGADVRGFFSLPLPRAVWEKTKAFRNRHFVRFVERSLCA